MFMFCQLTRLYFLKHSRVRNANNFINNLLYVSDIFKSANVGFPLAFHKKQNKNKQNYQNQTIKHALS